MLFTGGAISAEEAERYGLVNKVVPAGRLAEETLSLAKPIAQATSLTLALGKQSFYSQAALEETQTYRYAQEMMSLNAMSEDAQEGISAFLQKRPPKWKGK
jgi:enoyl-CoA hydratase/carnithine racemase